MVRQMAPQPEIDAMTVQCPGCKAHLSLSAALACPRCQTALPRAPAPNLTTKRHTTTASAGHKAGVGALLCCIPILGFIGYRLAIPSAGQEQARQVGRALLACQQAIQAQAQYGGADTPPYVRNYGTAGQFYFAWPTGSFAFPNGFGARTKMSASCIGDLETGTITQLTLNGQTIR